MAAGWAVVAAAIIKIKVYKPAGGTTTYSPSKCSKMIFRSQPQVLISLKDAYGMLSKN